METVCLQQSPMGPRKKCMMSLRIWAGIIAFLFAFAFSVFAQTGLNGANRVTPVAGESWLMHLGRSFDETSMGKTGRLGPAEPESRDRGSGSLAPLPVLAVEQNSALHGADLYRLNCRGCHGEEGLGAPPEINSVINPVRAGSATLIMARMRKSGMSINRAQAAELAGQSQKALLQRLHQGGRDMPPFTHLNEVEIRALTAYLKLLADVPGADAEQLAIREPGLRIGEHIVKSTCHICHSASGENPDAEQLAKGAIPPLSTLTNRTNRAQFVRKVTHGAPIVMGAPPIMCRGRMPVFYYLSEDEAADVYLYLSSYEPYQRATLDSATALVPDDQYPSESNSRPVKDISIASSTVRSTVATADEANSGQAMPLMIFSGMMVTLLLASGCVVTVRELKRLSVRGIDHRWVAVRPRFAGSSNQDGPRDDRLVA